MKYSLIMSLRGATKERRSNLHQDHLQPYRKGLLRRAKALLAMTAFVSVIPCSASAQVTAPTPTPAPKKDTAKPQYTLHTLKMEPIYVNHAEDNAEIDFARQSKGAAPLNCRAKSIDRKRTRLHSS